MIIFKDLERERRVLSAMSITIEASLLVVGGKKIHNF